MKRLLTRFLGLCVAIGFSAISLAAQSPVGYVVEIDGKWVLNGSKTLSQGERLPASGSIRRTSSSRDDRITIADMRGDVLASSSQKCEYGDCSGVITLPGKGASNSWLGALMDLVRTSPPRAELNQSRSGELSDNVVKLTDGKIDLSSVLKAQGEQYLRWRAMSQKKERVTAWTKPIKMDHSALVTGFQPGLYEINLMRSNGGNFEPVAAAWILVVTPADYENIWASFQQVRELTRKWGDTVQPKTTRLFLQVSLDNLARQSAK